MHGIFLTHWYHFLDTLKGTAEPRANNIGNFILARLSASENL